MYRILIVEDEEWIRKGIVQAIDWENLDLELADAVANGEQALHVLNSQPVNIVLTDMKMPVCDGASLLQQIKERNLGCKVIVLSEYTDFEYTRQAIHTNVVEYLLKPIDPLQLNAVLRNVIKILLEERSSHSDTLDPFDSVFLTALSRTSQEHFDAVCTKWEHVFANQYILVASVQPEIKYTSGYYESIRTLVANAPFSSRLYPLHDSKNIACIFTVIPSPFNAGVNATYRTWINSFLLHHKKLWGGDVRIGIGTKIEAPKLLRTGLSTSFSALQFLHYGHGEITFYENISGFSDTLSNPIVSEQQILGILSRCKKEDAAKTRQFLLENLCKQEQLYIPMIRKALIEFTLTLEKCSGKAGFSLNITSSIGENYIDRIERIEWIEEANSFLCDVLNQAFLNIATKQALTTSDIVDELIKRIETRYMDSINLMEISQQYHINYVYLCRKFKERTGELFTEFILRVRMTKAKELIEKCGFSEKETAALVGYPNPYHFSNSYRKYFQIEGADQDGEK